MNETLQELIWNIVHNVNIPASKAPLFARSPFLEFQVSNLNTFFFVIDNTDK